MKVLLCEDDIDQAQVIVRHLENLFCQVEHAAHGDAAQAILAERQFDVVLTDWLMPGCTGTELVQYVRHCDKYKQHYTYVIMVTALSNACSIDEAMQAGVDDYIEKPIRRSSLKARLKAAQRITHLHQALRAKNEELAALNAAAQQEARHDVLTGLPNRRRMLEEMRGVSAITSRHQTTYTVVMCDIDHFKGYNDTYGHAAGDTVIRDVAQKLKRSLRASDKVFRYGGEEFLILLYAQDDASTHHTLDRLRLSICDLHIPHSGSTHQRVTISLGATPLQHNEAPQRAIKRADEALYEAKSKGRNTFHIVKGTPIDLEKLSERLI